jgi:hypothetical protein
MVVYLASEECEQTHEIYSVGAGRYARIFVGLCPGWADTASDHVSAEGVRDNLEQIRDPGGYSIPANAAEEMVEAMKLIKG